MYGVKELNYVNTATFGILSLMPGARYGGGLLWDNDDSGKFYIFGGIGFGNSSSLNRLDDVWELSVAGCNKDSLGAGAIAGIVVSAVVVAGGVTAGIAGYLRQATNNAQMQRKEKQEQMRKEMEEKIERDLERDRLDCLKRCW